MLLVAAAVLLALGVRSVLVYRPLERGGAFQVVHPTWDYGDLNPNPLSREDVRDAESDLPRDVVHIQYRVGCRFRYGFQLRNRGRWPITVSNIPLEARFLAVGEGVRMAPVEDTGSTANMIPFRPFRLSPGKQRFIEVSYRLGDCGGPPAPVNQSQLGWDSHRVDYSIFGFPRHMNVRSYQAIVVLHGSDRASMRCEASSGG